MATVAADAVIDGEKNESATTEVAHARAVTGPGGGLGKVPAPRFGISRSGSVTGFGVKLYSASRHGPGANGDDDDEQHDAAITTAELQETERPDGDDIEPARSTWACDERLNIASGLTHFNKGASFELQV